MKNPFKCAGFDSIIGPGIKIHGDVIIDLGQTVVVDGEVTGTSVVCSEPNNLGKTTLVVGGEVIMAGDVMITSVTVTGKVKCKVLHVEGVLSVKSGAVVEAEIVRYRRLNVEPGAVLNARMEHLDQGVRGTEIAKLADGRTIEPIAS